MNLKRQIGIDIKNLYLKIMLNNMGIDIRRKRAMMVNEVRNKINIHYYHNIWKYAILNRNKEKYNASC